MDQYEDDEEVYVRNQPGIIRSIIKWIKRIVISILLFVLVVVSHSCGKREGVLIANNLPVCVNKGHPSEPDMAYVKGFFGWNCVPLGNLKPGVGVLTELDTMLGADDWIIFFPWLHYDPPIPEEWTEW